MCLNPISVTREIAGRKYTQVVPCGKCIQCKTIDQNEYVQRCMNAADDNGQVWFITLTYNNKNVPVNYQLKNPSELFDADGELIEDIDGVDYNYDFDKVVTNVCSSTSVTQNDEDDDSVLELNEDTGEMISKYRYLSLDREDIKKWKKRVKIRYERRYGRKLELNYIICGEYGPRTHRPHYHGMFFGLDRDAARMLVEDWNTHYGFTCFKYIPTFSVDGSNQVEKVAKYCSKYCVKVNELEDLSVIHQLVQRPRKMTSQGLGIPSIKKMMQIQRYQLCKDLFDYDENKPQDVLTISQQKLLINEIKKRRKASKLPRYLIKRLFYYKDCFGKPRAYEVQKMVSRSLQLDVQKDYSRELAEVAASNNLPETSEGLAQANKILQSRQEDRRQELFKTLYAYQCKHLKKSKF